MHHRVRRHSISLLRDQDTNRSQEKCVRTEVSNCFVPYNYIVGTVFLCNHWFPVTTECITVSGDTLLVYWGIKTLIGVKKSVCEQKFLIVLYRTIILWELHCCVIIDIYCREAYRANTGRHLEPTDIQSHQMLDKPSVTWASLSSSYSTIKGVKQNNQVYGVF